MDRSLYINTLTGKRAPLVRLLLAIKANMIRVPFLYYYLALFKLLGLLILTMTFIPSPEGSYGYRVTKVLRSITTFGMFGSSLTYSSYTLGSYIILIFLGIFLAIYMYTKKQTKIKEDFILTLKAKVLSVILAVIFNVLLILSQHLLEYLSFAFMILFNSGVDNSVTSYYYLVKDYSLFMNASLEADTYILLVVNFIGIILLNIFMYYAFKILNEPFFDTDFVVRMRYPGFSMLIYVIFQNFQCLHYVELFIANSDTLKIYKYAIFGISNVMLILGFYKSYESFNFKTNLTKVIYYLLTFSVISSIVEISLFLTDISIDTLQQLSLCFIFKILISYSFVSLTNHLNESLFVSRLKNSLFQQYDLKIDRKDLESLFFLMDILIKIEKGHELYHLSLLIKTILNHKADCVDDNCKCNTINNYSKYKLLDEMNFIIDSIFTNINFDKDAYINILFAEYLYYKRKSTLFAWGIMNTYISKNIASASSIEIFLFFQILLRKVCQFDDIIKKMDKYVHFNKVFKQVAINKFYVKKINKFIENFENLIKFKEKFDNTIKVDHYEGRIDSYVFQTELAQLVETCKNHQHLYKKMKRNIKKEFEHKLCDSIELSYRLHSFFIVFNKKTPKYINSILCNDTIQGEPGVTAVHNYFNAYFLKFFTNNKSSMNMIVEINKIFKIKYIDIRLCEALGHSYNKLINDDFHQIFPVQLRESHKKVLMNHFFIDKKVLFQKKTFAFTSSHSIYPMDFMVSTFPNLKKNFQAVVSINQLKTDQNRSFFFVVSENFDLMGISENFDTIYSLNYDMIDKLGIDMLKLFDIEEIIPTKFKNQLEELQNKKYLRQYDHLYSLSSYLFSLGDYDNRPQVQHMPRSVQAAFKNKESEISISKGGKNGRNQGGKPTNNRTAIGTQIFNKSEIYSGKENNSDLKDMGNGTITPVALQDTPPLNQDAPSENSKNAYNNYQRVENNDSKDKDKQETNKNEKDKSKNDTNGKEGKPVSSFTVIRDKKVVVKNLESIANACKDLELGFQLFDKLMDSISKFKKSSNPDNDEKSGSSRKNVFNNKRNSSQSSKKTVSENFHINFSIRKINDTAFFLLGIKEKKIFKKSNNQSPHNNFYKDRDLIVVEESPEEISLMTQHTMNTNITANPAKNKHKTNKREQTVTASAPKILGQYGKKELKKHEELMNDPYDILSDIPKNTKLNNGVVLSEEKLDKEEMRKKKEKNKDIIITLILSVFLLINLIVAILVLDFRLFVQEITRDFFTINYWKMRHESVFTALFSAVMSHSLLLTNSTTFQTNYLNSINVIIPKEGLPFVIEERSKFVRDSLFHFYTAVETSRYKMKSLEELLFIKTDSYNSIILTWEKKPLNYTYMDMVEYVASYAQLFQFETNWDNYIQDLNEGMFFRKFENLPNKAINSEYTKLFYFLNENIKKIEKKFIEFTEALNTSLEVFNNSWRKTTSFIEFLNVGFALVLIVVIHYTLIRFDRSLFQVLLSMFLNMRNGKKANFKATYECELMKIRIKKYKDLIVTFTIENIRNFHETIYLEEDGINKLIKQKDGPISKILGINQEVDTPSKEKLLVDPSLGGSILDLNSSKNPLAGLVQGNDLGLNENNNEDSSKNNKNPEDPVKEGDKGIEKKHSTKKTVSKRGKKQDKDDDLEVQTFVTNGQILKKTKNYSLKFVTITKLLITFIFIIYIVFILSNVIVNFFNFNILDEDLELVSSYVLMFPQLNRLFNMVRLAIINNDMSYTESFDITLASYYKAEQDSSILYDRFQNKLPESWEYYVQLNSLNYDKRSELICQGTVLTPYCKYVLKKENGFNKEGLKIATKTVLQKLMDVYKDYIKLRGNENPSQLAALSNPQTITRYFLNEDFGNVNSQMCTVFLPTTNAYFNAIHNDITFLLDEFINLSSFLGVGSICLNLTIILYIVLIFFRRLSECKDYISYSAAKFNRALFEQ